MSELMEKDVLMEEVAATIAYIASRTHNNPQTHTFCKELKSCGDLRETLLAKAPKDIYAVAIRSELSALKNSVKDNPVNYLIVHYLIAPLFLMQLKILHHQKRLSITSLLT